MPIVCRTRSTGEVSYQVKERDNLGRYYPTKTFHSKSEARQYLALLHQRKHNGQLVEAELRNGVQVKDYLVEWLANKEHKISEGWVATQKRLIATCIAPWIGEKRLVDVQPPDVGRILAAAYESGLGDQSALHIYNILRQSFNDAVEYFGYLQACPVKRKDRPKVRRTERESLSPDESWRLLEACREHYIGPAIWISMLSGMRPSEVQALQWSAVDLESRRITIRAAFKRTVNRIEPFPKQGDWGIGVIPEPLAEYLASQKRRSLFVAPGAEGGMLEYKKLYNGLRKMCEEAKVPRISPHELRHSCTEIWMRSGASLEDMRRLLNHKSSATTLRYVHRNDFRLDELARSLAVPKMGSNLIP